MDIIRRQDQLLESCSGHVYLTI